MPELSVSATKEATELIVEERTSKRYSMSVQEFMARLGLTGDGITMLTIFNAQSKELKSLETDKIPIIGYINAPDQVIIDTLHTRTKVTENKPVELRR